MRNRRRRKLSSELIYRLALIMTNVRRGNSIEPNASTGKKHCRAEKFIRNNCNWPVLMFVVYQINVAMCVRISRNGCHLGRIEISISQMICVVCVRDNDEHSDANSKPANTQKVERCENGRPTAASMVNMFCGVRTIKLRFVQLPNLRRLISNIRLWLRHSNMQKARSLCARFDVRLPFLWSMVVCVCVCALHTQ